MVMRLHDADETGDRRSSMGTQPSKESHITREPYHAEGNSCAIGVPPSVSGTGRAPS
jgi:hypothetical protein